MLAHDTLSLAFETRLLTLSVCTTGSGSFAAVADGYTRASGSFITDGFVVGQEILVSGFAANGYRNVIAVTASKLTTREVLVAESAASGRTILVGVPELQAWENVKLTTEAERWSVDVDYVPQPPVMLSMPYDGGSKEDTGLYVVKLFGTANRGPRALFKMADAVLSHFKAGTEVYADADMQVRVQGSPTAPSRGQLLQLDGGVPFIAVTIPWRAFSLND